MIIYFSKINLESVQLLALYKEKEIFNNIKRNIHSYFKSGTIYEVLESYKDSAGEVHPIVTKYKLKIGMESENYIFGTIYKMTTLYYKRLNDNTSEVESHAIPTIEDVRFYFDVDKEIVGYHTRNRFGYKEFNIAFSGILNMCMENNNSDMRFSSTLYNEGLEIEDIEKELKSINNIKRLEFNFKLPNPADDDMIERLQEKLTNTAEQMEDANASSMSILFDSNGGMGLNIDSTEIKKNISRVSNLTKGIDDKDVTRNGYARVVATSKDGKIYTTEEQKPIKREILDESSDSFFKACKDTISNIFEKRASQKRQKMG